MKGKLLKYAPFSMAVIVLILSGIGSSAGDNYGDLTKVQLEEAANSDLEPKLTCLGCNCGNDSANSSEIANFEELSMQYGLMEPTIEDLQRWDELYRSATEALISPEIMAELGDAPEGQYYSLLDHLTYTPSERYQGSCGNCWAWAGTGVMEIALNVEKGIKDRLSIQYLNSNYNDGGGSNWACCGGWLEYLATFYRNAGMTIPWSNTNAEWLDGNRSCGSYASNVEASSIDTSTSYTLTSIESVTVPTYEVGSSNSIDNIKNILHQGRAIWFAFFLPSSSDWSYFMSDFWEGQNESAVWDPSYSPGISGASSNGHAVLCVGYDDRDPENSYWIMLNCWGTTPDRPNGLFLVDMDMNYDCWYNFEGDYPQQSFYWMTLDIEYSVPLVSAPTVTNAFGADNLTTSSATLNGNITDTGGEVPEVYIYWGDNDGKEDPDSWDNVAKVELTC